MAASTMTTLPSRVILYIPTRVGFNGLILMNCVHENEAWTIQPAEQSSLNLMVAKPSSSNGIYFANLVVRNCDGILLNKRVRAHPDIVVTEVSTGANICVMSMTQHATVFGSHTLKKNFAVTSAPSPLPSPVLVAPSPVPSPSPRQKKTVRVPEINPYVARQLFDLAVHRKEQCPIVAEDFILGNTAVMPCGHLFMTIAIEESFKKEPNKCPWCRQVGVPAFV